MSTNPTFAAVHPLLAAALSSRGFTTLTPVQEAVLDPALAGRDLRICSQTGSGKTVAVGLVLAAEFEAAGQEPSPGSGPRPPAAASRAARPDVLIIAPTRELAAQLARELGWLFEPLGVRVASVTGGTSIPAELRALREGPRVVIGTPGRLVDHLDRGAIDASCVRAVVLDEADQMLDLGFREALETILSKTPSERRTHLISATFSREVLSLANRLQRSAVQVAGAHSGDANDDISHVAHLVRYSDREAALVNLLLLAPGERTLVFVRTRADASEIADRLSAAGFSARAISGDLEQWERTKTLEAFRSGAVLTLVATDVAARGIDVAEIGRVIHADPPGDAEALTHRSGRTGRAGRKGVSIVLVPPAARETVQRQYRRARIEAEWKPAPSQADVLDAADARLLNELLAPAASAGEGASAPQPDPRLRALATKLLAVATAEGAVSTPLDLVTTLLGRIRSSGPCAPKPFARVDVPSHANSNSNFNGGANGPRAPRFAPRAPSQDGGGYASRPESPAGAFVAFRINWGGRHGADARRLLAMLCRRGSIQGNQIGAIRVGDFDSTFEVAQGSAGEFARAVQKPDTRDPRIRIDAIVDQGSKAPVVASASAFAPIAASVPVAASAPITASVPVAAPAPVTAPAPVAPTVRTRVMVETRVGESPRVNRGGTAPPRRAAPRWN